MRPTFKQAHAKPGVLTKPPEDWNELATVQLGDPGRSVQDVEKGNAARAAQWDISNGNRANPARRGARDGSAWATWYLAAYAQFRAQAAFRPL